mgnify:CR=1 FL=1
MNTDQQELAAYQRAVELAKDELSALRRRAELAEALALTLEKQRDQAEEDALVTRAAILEWKNAYDRLAGVFDLRIAVDECHAALAGYVGSYYDVVLGEMAKRAERAEADNAALLHLARSAVECVRKLCYDDGTDAAVKQADRWMHGFEQALQAEHPGATLLAELAAARAIVTALRMHHDAGGEVWHSIDADLAAYDKAVKARTE